MKLLCIWLFGSVYLRLFIRICWRISVLSQFFFVSLCGLYNIDIYRKSHFHLNIQVNVFRKKKKQKTPFQIYGMRLTFSHPGQRLSYKYRRHVSVEAGWRAHRRGSDDMTTGYAILTLLCEDIHELLIKIN